MSNRSVPPHIREILEAQKEEDKRIAREAKQRARAERVTSGRCSNKYYNRPFGVTVISIGSDEKGYREVKLPTIYESIIRSEHWFHVTNNSEFQCNISANGAARDIVRSFAFYGRDPESISTMSLRRLIALCAWGELGKVARAWTLHAYNYIPLESLQCNVYYTDQQNIERFYTPTTWKHSHVRQTP
jgi:hypothetical protein